VDKPGRYEAQIASAIGIDRAPAMRDLVQPRLDRLFIPLELMSA
jgi:hypothetical protein